MMAITLALTAFVLIVLWPIRFTVIVGVAELLGLFG
jgi:hypothetical protein